MALINKDEKISNYISIAHRYVRSIDMVRDLEDKRALDGYVLTPAVRDALRRILNGLRFDSTHRSFRVTGPYGTGKSALGLLLARLFIEKFTRKGIATEILENANAGIKVNEISDYIPIVLNGRRTGFGDALLEVIQTSAEGQTGGIRVQSIVKKAKLLQQHRSNGIVDDSKILELLKLYSEEVSSIRKGRGGVLLLIDEMGRFLEHAAINRTNHDPALFQQLAELAGGASNSPFAVVAFLHHRFADYAAGFGEWVEAEWTRSAERYEDISFHESFEQITFLLAQAISHNRKDNSVEEEACLIYNSATLKGIFPIDQAEISSLAPCLYPLHPCTIILLSNLARRFGQNERSIFSFLQSFEPFGFQRFIQENNYRPGIWYRVSDLFDYVAAQITTKPFSADRERRWNLLVDAINESSNLEKIDIGVLKCIGMISVFEPIKGLKADLSTIVWCLGEEESKIKSAIKRLVGLNVIYRRPHRDDYSLWSSSSVDIERWLEEARIRVPLIHRIDEVLASLPPSRPIIAHRHYHSTGTLRAFSVQIWSWQERVLNDSNGECDGSIFIVPVYPDERIEDIRQRIIQISKKTRKLVLFRIQQITPSNLAKAHELRIWQWIQGNCKELRVDDLARREVQAKLTEAKHSLMDSLDPFTNPLSNEYSTLWIHQGKEKSLLSQSSVSKMLSQLCDEVFSQSPILKNELINRSKLSSAAASARMRLLELMVSNTSSEYLGLTGAPPERTIYLSIFHASGIHADVGQGKWDFVIPKRDPLGWKPVWDCLGDHLKAHGICTFPELINRLSEPPYGLRSGVSLLIIAAFMQHERQKIALMERNTFQPDITGAHFMRLAKNPGNFALRYIGKNSGDSDLLQRISDDVILWRGQERPEPAIKSIAEAVYRWWNNLSSYSLETNNLSKRAQSVRLAIRKAQEPIDLIYKQLPEACGLKEINPDKIRKGELDTFVETLNSSLQEIIDANKKLRKQVEEAILDAFEIISIDALRKRIARECGQYRQDLADYRLRAFIERTDSEMKNDKWLDSIGNLLIGHRLDEWRDTTIKQFKGELFSIAQHLKKWLALMRNKRSAIFSVHVVDPSGKEEVITIWDSKGLKSDSVKMEKIRKIIGNTPEATSLLARLLAEFTATVSKKESADG